MSEFLLYHDGHDKTPSDVSTEEFLAEWGVDPTNTQRGGLVVTTRTHEPNREIILLQRKKGKLGANLGKTTGWIHRATLTNSNAVEMVNGVKYEKVDENGNLHIDIGGEKLVLEVDNIVMCAGQVKQNHLEQDARGTQLGDRVFAIGGAYEAGELDAKRAIDMGTRLAIKIHEDVIPGKHKFEAAMGAEEKMQKVLKKWM